jgi:phage gp46-like protein
MSDILLKQTNDGGECTVTNGVLLTSDGLESAAILSLFGGNSNDSGLAADDAIQFWGNLIEPDPAAQQRSQTQYLLSTLAITPANLQRFEEAALADLAWFEDEVADSVAVVASMPCVNRIQLNVVIIVNGVANKFKLSPPSLS